MSLLLPAILTLPSFLLPGALLYLIQREQDEMGEAEDEQEAQYQDLLVELVTEANRRGNLCKDRNRHLMSSPLRRFCRRNRGLIAGSRSNLRGPRTSRLRQLSLQLAFQIGLMSSVLAKRKIYSSSYPRTVAVDPKFKEELRQCTVLRDHREWSFQNSPMRHYIRTYNMSLVLACCGCIRQLRRFEAAKLPLSPMRDLCSREKGSIQAASSLRDACRVQRKLTQWIYRRTVLPRISGHSELVMSPMRGLARRCSTEILLHRVETAALYCTANSSPLRAFVTDTHIQNYLENEYTLRQYDWEFRNNSPMREFVQNNGTQLTRRAALFQSPMHQYAKSNGHIIEVLAYLREQSRVRRSPLYPIMDLAYCIQFHREAGVRRALRATIVSELKETLFGPVYQKLLSGRLRKDTGVSDVIAQPGYTSVYIVFPAGRFVSNRFLLETGLEHVEAYEDYFGPGPDQFQSYCVASVRGEEKDGDGDALSLTDYVTLAGTYKQLSHLVDDDARVLLTTDLSKIQVQVNRGAMHYTRIYFVRRDREDFTLSDYNSVKAIHPGTVGFVNKWLGEELVIILESPYTDAAAHRNAVSDLIQRVNLIKGIIFARVVDQVKWLDWEVLP